MKSLYFSQSFLVQSTHLDRKSGFAPEETGALRYAMIVFIIPKADYSTLSTEKCSDNFIEISGRKEDFRDA